MYIKMNALKMTLEHHMHLFVDNAAFNVAKLLEESKEEQAANANRKMLYEALKHYSDCKEIKQ